MNCRLCRKPLRRSEGSSTFTGLNSPSAESECRSSLIESPTLSTSPLSMNSIISGVSPVWLSLMRKHSSAVEICRSATLCGFPLWNDGLVSVSKPTMGCVMRYLIAFRQSRGEFITMIRPSKAACGNSAIVSFDIPNITFSPSLLQI